LFDCVSGKKGSIKRGGEVGFAGKKQRLGQSVLKRKVARPFEREKR